MKILAKTPTTYASLKQKLKTGTIQYGFALTSGYFICKGAAEGVSAMVGTASSLAYVNALSSRVDTLEKNTFPSELLIPVGMVAFETLWNHAPFAFDFDYTASFFGFFVYKGALLNLLYDVIQEMLLPEKDNKNEEIYLEKDES
jgi:hypothetical protein